MWIKEIDIIGVGGIQELQLALDPKMNLICGPNGIGKTTILESVAHTFSSGRTNVLKRNAKSGKSHIRAKVDLNGMTRISNIEFSEFVPSQQAQINGLNDLSTKLLSLKINRTFEHRALPAVGKDTSKPNGSAWNEARAGIDLNDVKN